MQALVGQEAPFDHGREQMQLLAGLEVTAKSVERTAEAIGADIAQREQGEIQKALQLDLPVIAGEPMPFVLAVSTMAKQSPLRLPRKRARTRRTGDRGS